MNSKLLSRMLFTRLRVPIPAAKLSIIYSAAKILMDSNNRSVFWEELLDWISKLNFESEVVEALAIVVLAKDSDCISIDKLNESINKPSPLSDILIQEISGTPSLINTWRHAHSIEPLPFFSNNDLLKDLTEGKEFPPILSTRIKKLEKEYGYPFANQWLFEFQRLIDTYGLASHGHWEYFTQDDRENNTSQFITKRTHVARSAYLRTLSFAYDVWGLPETRIIHEAKYATPIDITFLKMPPGSEPSWTKELHNDSPTTTQAFEEILQRLLDDISKYEKSSELLFLNSALKYDKKYKAYIEVISCLHNDSPPSPDEVFMLHDSLPGRVILPRSSNWNIEVPQLIDKIDKFVTDSGGTIMPTLVPCVNNHIGYMHVEHFHRVPHIPSNYTSSSPIIAQPKKGGMDILLDGRSIGDFRYWNYLWGPSYNRTLGPSCGISLTILHDEIIRCLNIDGMKLNRFWRAKVLTRKSDYGKWEEKVFLGRLDSSQA